MSGAAEPHRLLAFVLDVGRTLSLAGTAVNETQDRLLRIAAANDVSGARIVVFPTALMITLGPADRTTVESIPRLANALRLDQVAALQRLIEQAERGDLDPAEGLRWLHRIRSMKPRFGPAVVLFGHTVLTVGVCLILQPTLPDVVIAGCLGVLVGPIVATARQHHTLRVLAPVGAALLVSAVSFTAIGYGIADPGLGTLIAPLVTLIPGGMLTTAAIELANGELVAGASRLVSGCFQLLLLAFGIVAGADLVGLPRSDVLTAARNNHLGWWAPWLGVALFGVAVRFYFSAPPRTLRWLLLVLFTAWTGKLAGGLLAGGAVSGFAGALAMTPVALAIARLPGGPPSQVTFLPAFWLLVPGAVGLIGVTRTVGNPAAADLSELVDPFASIIAITLGILCGASAYRTLTRLPRCRSRT